MHPWRWHVPLWADALWATTWISVFPYLAMVEMEPLSSWFLRTWSAESLCCPVINAENQRGTDVAVSPSNIQDVTAARAQLILTNPPLRRGQLSHPPTPLTYRHVTQAWASKSERHFSLAAVIGSGVDVWLGWTHENQLQDFLWNCWD